MDAAQTHLVAKMAQLFNNRDNADITLSCEGETIKAHSLILESRWNFVMAATEILFLTNF